MFELLSSGLRVVAQYNCSIGNASSGYEVVGTDVVGFIESNFLLKGVSARELARSWQSSGSHAGIASVGQLNVAGQIADYPSRQHGHFFRGDS